MKSGVRLNKAQSERLMVEAFWTQMKKAWCLYMEGMGMSINPFDENDQFTCPRCGCHEFGTYQESEPYKVLCSGPECTYISVDTRHVPNNPKTAAEIAFDEIVKLCDVPTWDYPGQVIRDVKMLRDQRDDFKERLALCQTHRDQYLRERDSARQALGNLLALIHGDGGHHTSRVGEAQSMLDARKVWSHLQIAVEAAGIHADLNGQLSRNLQSTQVERDQAVADRESMRVQRDTLQDQSIDLLERLRKHEPDAAPLNPFASQDARAVLSDLLAIIHRDGGHRETEVGPEEAAKEAQKVHQLQRVTIDALKSRLSRLVKACGADRPEPICEGCGRRKATLMAFGHNMPMLLCSEVCEQHYPNAPKIRLEELEE